MNTRKYMTDRFKKNIYLTTNLQELCLINNTLTEICYGIELGENDIINRLGASYDDIMLLLKDVQSIIETEQSKKDK